MPISPNTCQFARAIGVRGTKVSREDRRPHCQQTGCYGQLLTCVRRNYPRGGRRARGLTKVGNVI